MKLSDLTKFNLNIKMVTDEMVRSLFKYSSNSEYKKYVQTSNNPNRTIVKQTKNALRNKTTTVYSDKWT